MINGISDSFQSMNAISLSSQNTQLSENQKTELLDILAKYDPDSMTESQKQSLLEELKSSGIRPTDAVRETIASAGFELGEPPQGPPPEGMQGMPPAGKPDFVNEAVSKYENGELTEDDIEDLILQLKNWNEQPQGILLDQKT